MLIHSLVLGRRVVFCPVFRLYGRSLVVPRTGGYIARLSTRNCHLFPRVGEMLFARFFTAPMPIFLFLMHFYCCGSPGRYITSVTGLDPVLYIVTRTQAWRTFVCSAC